MEPIVNNNMGGQPPMATPPMATPPMATPPMATPPMGGVDDMGGGGGAFIKKSGGIKAFFEDINVLDVTFMAIVFGAIIYQVQYTRFMMMLEKSGYADLSTKLQKLESSIAAQKAEMNASGRMDKMRKRPLMRIG
jgi:hypothetical protein